MSEEEPNDFWKAVARLADMRKYIPKERKELSVAYWDLRVEEDDE